MSPFPAPPPQARRRVRSPIAWTAWAAALGVVVVTCLAAAAAARRAELSDEADPHLASPRDDDGQPTGESCAECHEGSVPLYHDQEFREVSHGVAARVDRATCLGCHSRQDHCRACHEERPPSWHSDAFQRPAWGRAEREEHARIALARGADCLECHAGRFHDQCAGCHEPQEWAPRSEPGPAYGNDP